MDEDSYTTLLALVTPLIEKQDTIMRCAISAHERLSATLRYLATGRNYEDLKFSTIISLKSAIFKLNHNNKTNTTLTKSLKQTNFRLHTFIHVRAFMYVRT